MRGSGYVATERAAHFDPRLLPDIRALAQSERSMAHRRRAAAATVEMFTTMPRPQSVVGLRAVKPPSVLSRIAPASRAWVLATCFGMFAAAAGGFWSGVRLERALAGRDVPPTVALPPPDPTVTPISKVVIEPMCPHASEKPSPTARPSVASVATRERTQNATSAKASRRTSVRGWPRAKRVAAARPQRASAAPSTELARKRDFNEELDVALREERPNQALAALFGPPEPRHVAPVAARRTAPAESDGPDAADQIKAVLASLQPKARQCFRRFQIPGTAEVDVTVTPKGTIKASAVRGDFDGTPTGDCIQNELAAASFPSFSGKPVRVRHSYSLR